MSDRVVLLAEDDENDSFLLEQAFQTAQIRNPLQIVRDGKEALDYLAGTGNFADRKKYPWPCLVLLDLKMPLLDGFGVLEWCDRQGLTSSLPIVVMSSSNQEDDVRRAMDMGATGYIVKPSTFQYLVTAASELKSRWIAPNPKKQEAIREI